jgi:4-amino-4-deoxy-L-arabinose transferase-like glycosyltransferase
MATSPATATLRERSGSLSVSGVLAWPAAAAALAAAVALRVTELGRVQPDPFYDAAVRSMGGSWHAFLFGALEPGGSVSIDKPPLGLWLQVASTKALGFSTASLLLPEALGGCAAVALLFVLVRSLWGRAEAVASAAALAVLPVSVLTARSDTMDSLTAALTLLAAVLVVRSARTGGRWPLAAAGAAVGLAFNAKVFQALIPVPALVVLYVAASPLPLGERLSRLVLASAVAAAVGVAWLAVVSTAPGREQPWAFGSTNGSALNATFVYNGIDRVGATPAPRPATRRRPNLAAHRAATPWRRLSPPGPLRLAGTGGALRSRLAPELVPALLIGALALLAAAAAAVRQRGSELSQRARLARAGAAGLAVWLLTGIVLFSFVGRLQVRYLEGFTPAVAAILGTGTVALVRRAHLPVWVAGLAVVALLVAPARASLAVVHAGASDSGHLGAMPARETALLSRYLRRHSAHTPDEVASATAIKAAPLIVRDGRPVLMLAAQSGQPVTSLHRLKVALHHHRVRYLLTAPCRASSAARPRGCGRVNRWAQVHGRDVTRRAGLQGRGVLFRLPTYRPQRHKGQHQHRGRA